MFPYLAGKAKTIHSAKTVFGFELFGWRAVRVGNWKATWISRPFGVSEWELFNLLTDPGEARDLSNQEPGKLVQLRRQWKRYAAEVGVVLPEQSVVNAP